MRIQNKVCPKTNEQIQGTNEESIIYSTKKLNSRFKLLKYLLYCSFAIIVFDFICVITIPLIFLDIINIIALIIIFFSYLYCLFVFRHNFEIISYDIYQSTNRVIIILIICLVLFYIDMFYLLLFKILLNFENLEDIIIQTFKYIFISIILFFFYFLLNIFFPFVIFYKLMQVKDSIKELGKAHEQSYDIIPTTEIQMTSLK